MPYGRYFDKKTCKWLLDEDKAKLIRWAAKEYLNGGSLREIAETLRTRHNEKLGYHYLLLVLKERCGDKWEVVLKRKTKKTKEKIVKEKIVYDIPRILDDDTIQRIKERLKHNNIENRKDVRKYVLTGFIRCDECGKSLSGQTQINRYKTEFKYYNHPGGKYEKCKAFNSIPLQQIENAVFHTIFENIADVPSFNKAIADSLPDEKQIKNLNDQIKAGEKELKKNYQGT